MPLLVCRVERVLLLVSMQLLAQMCKFTSALAGLQAEGLL